MKSLKDVIKLKPEEVKRFREIRTELLNDKYVKVIIDKYKIDDDLFDRFLSEIYTYSTEKKTCNNCGGLSQCKFLNPGYNSDIIFDNGLIMLEYNPCRYKSKELEEIGPSNLVDTMYFSRDLVNKSGDLHVTKERKDVLSEVSKFISKYNKDNYVKGLYLHSSYGNGKTYILSYIALSMANKGYNVLMAYFPDLSREIRSSISLGTLEDKINKLKEIDILIIDEIGGEMASAWFRDEVLGPILQHRMVSDKPTFFSSNYDLEGLYEHYSLGNDKVKAARIIERIKVLSKQMELKGKNYRL